MSVFFGLIGAFGFVVASILLIVATIRKKPKKQIAISLAACFVLFVFGLVLPSTPSANSTKYKDAIAQATSLQEQTDALSKENVALKEEQKKTAEQITALQAEYNSYKEKMKPYEALSEAEAEANKIEAEKLVKQQKEEQEAQQKAAAEKKAAEEARGYETGITFNNLARNPDDFEGEKVKFTGKVIQVIEGTGVIQIRFAVNSNYDAILLGEYKSSIVSSRILEDDIITIYGTSMGTISYKSTIGGTITVPAVAIDRIDQ